MLCEPPRCCEHSKPVNVGVRKPLGPHLHDRSPDIEAADSSAHPPRKSILILIDIVELHRSPLRAMPSNHGGPLTCSTSSMDPRLEEQDLLAEQAAIQARLAVLRSSPSSSLVPRHAHQPSRSPISKDRLSRHNNNVPRSFPCTGATMSRQTSSVGTTCLVRFSVGICLTVCRIRPRTQVLHICTVRRNILPR